MMMRWDRLFAFALVASLVVVGSPSRSAGQSNACLLEIHDATGAVVPAALCQQATNHKCTFNLQLCVNQVEPGCTPANFTKKQIRARGHCGPVGNLRVQTAGSAPVCGTLTGVKVRTKDSGKKPGQCTIRTEARSSATKARVDVDRVTLTCNPSSIPCPSTTTTTTAGSSTTSTTR